MKKILAGYIYRLFRGLSFWVFVLSFIIVAGYLNYMEIWRDDFVTVTRTNETVYENGDPNYPVSADNVNQLRYSAIGVSPLDMYRFFSEPYEQETFDKLSKRPMVAFQEKDTFFGVLTYMIMVPAIFIAVYIPIFFGSLFSDNTVKNLIGSGHSRARIYSAALILTVLLDILLMIITVCIVVFWCLYFKWMPPVYLPMVATWLVAQLLAVVAISSIELAVLFISKKRTLAFIASFFIAIAFFMPNTFAVDAIYSNQIVDEECQIRYMALREEKGRNVFLYKFDPLTFEEGTYYEGERIDRIDSGLNPAVKYTLMTIIYMDPLLIYNSSFIIDQYMCYRDGIMAISMANSVIWVALSSVAAVAVFRKREI